MKIKLCLFLVVACMLNCKVDDTKNGSLNAQTQQVQQNTPQKKASYKIGEWGPDRAIPNACNLIGKKYIGELFQVDPEKISVKDGNPYGIESRSCFFRWDSPELPNAGVLIMVSKNPQPDKVDDWATIMIDSKIAHGDGGAEGEGMVKYQPLPELGTSGAYSHQLAKYYWQLDGEVVFMLAFNMNSHPDQQKAVALTIGNRITNNFLKKI